MLYAYLDESGTEAGSPALGVAGVLFGRKELKMLNLVWKRGLKAAGISYFHAVKCAHLRGEFEGKSRAFADSMYRDFIALVAKHSCGSAVVFCINEKKFNPFDGHEWGFGPYAACTYSCMELVLKIAQSWSQWRGVRHRNGPC